MAQRIPYAIASLDVESVIAEIDEAGESAHDLSPEEVSAIKALPEATIHAALNRSTGDDFWEIYDSTRRKAISTLRDVVDPRKEETR